MSQIEFSDFFSRYLDPHKDEVAEWGAFAGLHGRGRESAVERVKKLAAAAVSRAGLGSPARLSYAQKRLAEIERGQASVRERLHSAYARLTGTKPSGATRFHRKVVEAAFDLLALPCLPVALVSMWPVAAYRGWNCSRLERAEGAVSRLSRAAENYLTIELEWYFEKGDSARRIRAGLGTASLKDVGDRP